MSFKITDTETGKELVLSERKDVNSPQAWGFIWEQLKGLVFILPVVGFVGTLVWKGYGQEFVKEVVKKEQAPIVKEMKKIKSIESDVNMINFRVKQMHLMLKKFIPDSIIRQVENETKRFQPGG